METLTPREIFEWFSNKRCIICDAELTVDERAFKFNDTTYECWVNCFKCVHYDHIVRWKDPKKDIVSYRESFWLHEEDYSYTVDIYHNHIEITKDYFDDPNNLKRMSAIIDSTSLFKNIKQSEEAFLERIEQILLLR